MITFYHRIMISYHVDMVCGSTYRRIEYQTHFLALYQVHFMSLLYPGVYTWIILKSSHRGTRVAFGFLRMN